MRVFVPRGACGAGAHGGSARARGIGGRGGRVAVRHVQIESVINSLVNKIILKRKKKTYRTSRHIASRAPVCLEPLFVVLTMMVRTVVTEVILIF